MVAHPHYVKACVFLFALSGLTTAAVPASGRPTDETIVGWVRSALASDPRVKSGDIAVKSIEGIVTLDGTVTTLAEKEFADLEAKKIRGVQAVIDKLEVKPAYRLDAEIRQDLRRRIIRSSFIKSENVGVSVENGVVVLRGTVGSAAEKNEVSLLAAEVRGVKSVDNHLAVAYEIKPADMEIRKNAAAKLSRDVYLTGLPITVSVKNGVATLNGETHNVYEKDRAEDDLMNLFNVTDVKNDLKVAWPKSEKTANNLREIPDSALSAMIREELSLDPRFDVPGAIKVQDQHGAITLTGSVPSYYQKQLAERDVEQIAGVEWVNNLLVVKGVWRDDAGLYMDIRDALASDYRIGGDKVDFYVLDGVVSLKGNVNSDYEKSCVDKDVAGIIGVKDIKDNLIVEWVPVTSDDTLKARIFDRLAANWDTWLLLDKIIINVKEGNAVLTGTVDNRVQREEAGWVASQTTGVVSVDDRLKVQENNNKIGMK
ncbi:MAG TPA: BON domain-containing protein [Chitinivibrionales bacterium]|nr:BON domain-containing protein [Chitinivibrionales bacterium]